MKAKDKFETIYNMNNIDKGELLSIIWSNPVEDDFISTMCVLMEVRVK